MDIKSSDNRIRTWNGHVVERMADENSGLVPTRKKKERQAYDDMKDINAEHHEL